MTDHNNFSRTVPAIEIAQIGLLERLSNANGVSGDESEVRAIVLEQISPFVDEIKVDSLGNVLATHIGKSIERLRVMLIAHMDEVGFMVSADAGDGLFEFLLVGGIDVRELPGKPVLIGHEHIPGIIGARAHHLTTIEERRKKIPLTMLRMDTGLGDAKTKIKPGDRASFATRFLRNGSTLRGKALDDRLGIVSIIELLKKPPENIDLYVIFSTQEEIGSRGAQVASYSINPDIVINIDCTPAYDMPAWDNNKNTRYHTSLRAGPAIHIVDKDTLSDPILVRHMVQSAEAYNIPYQITQPDKVGSDVSAVHRKRSRIPSVSISIPVRYVHAPIELVSMVDWQNSLKLLFHALTEITPKVLSKNNQAINRT